MPITFLSAGATNSPILPADYDLIWGGISFAIILVVILKMVLPKMNAMLDERSAAIEGNIAKADEAQKQAEAALEKYNEQLKSARREASEIRDAAREDGKKIVAEARNTATAEAARVVSNAQAQIEAEHQSALVALRSEVGTLAIDLAGRVVGDSLADDKRAASVVDRFLADLETAEAKK